ncbi:DinB family protein [Panacibacter sp. DH6]|uniref:DinB family protein n=1 Tax=Panacibacter microcysteis TaxID=2793269 RepID=A0A931EAZ6_9BACT|nr:DinB family protein [Panacibacter microcysteis]MBG9377101.1 DinB family protein [Panacibacter microcysteis]
MTKQYFKELAAFNLWANNIACGWLGQISDEQWNRHVTSSFNSIQETVLHILSAEKAWLQRFRNETVEWLQATYKGSREEHITLWKETSAQLKSFIDDFDEQALNTNLDFKRLNGVPYSMPYYQLFAHVVNHATYHRGQLVTMLRQVGFNEISSTDLLGYYR